MIETVSSRLVLKCLVFCAGGSEDAEEYLDEFLNEAAPNLPMVEDPTRYGPTENEILNRATDKTYFEAQVD